MTPLRRLGIAAVLLVTPPAHACSSGEGEATLLLAVGVGALLLLLLVSPLVVVAHDLVCLPFGHRPGPRGALVRAVLGAGGAAVGLWGAVLKDGAPRPWFLGAGILGAALLAWGAARFQACRAAAPLSSLRKEPRQNLRLC